MKGKTSFRNVPELCRTRKHTDTLNKYSTHTKEFILFPLHRPSSTTHPTSSHAEVPNSPSQGGGGDRKEVQLSREPGQEREEAQGRLRHKNQLIRAPRRSEGSENWETQQSRAERRTSGPRYYNFLQMVLPLEQMKKMELSRSSYY